jgi:ABC-type phosphate/phosphonate transport system substrate-binding protein
VNARSIIEALAAGTIDVGPLDSYSHDLLQCGAPELAAKVKTIASTAAAPIPPFVAPGMVANADLARLRGALDAASTAPELAAQRAALLLDRFTVPAESDYDALASVLDAATRYRDAW